MLFKAEYNLYSLQKYLLNFGKNHEVHAPFVNDLILKIKVSLSTDTYQNLVDELDKFVCYWKKFPLDKHLKEIYTTLKESCIRSIARQFNLESYYAEPLHKLAQLYLYILHPIKDNEGPNYPDPIALVPLQKLIKQRIQEKEKYEIYSELKLLKNETQKVKSPLSKQEEHLLEFIQKSLSKIANKIDIISQKSNAKELYKAYQKSPYLFQKINQYSVPGGHDICYGIACSVIIPDSNPFETVRKDFQYTERMSLLSKRQRSEKKDQKYIKKRPITLVTLCPDLLQQAKEIFSIAQQQIGKDLLIKLSSSHGAHACFIKVLSDSRIKYLDSMHGAYCFNNQDEFLEFYVSSFLIYPNEHFSRYQIIDLKYAPNTQPQKQIKEHLITLMTGPQYPNYNLFAPFIFYALIAYYFASPSNYNGIITFSLLSFLYLCALPNKLYGMLAIPNFFKQIPAELFTDNRQNAEIFLDQQMQKKKPLSPSFFENKTVKINDCIDTRSIASINC